MELIKNGNIGTYGGTNYFILPKLYDDSISFDSLNHINELVYQFHIHFGYMKNQTIHIFTSFDWISLIGMMEQLTPTQFDLLYDMEEKFNELRHFHNVQKFLQSIMTHYGYFSLSFINDNRIILHCNTEKELLKHVSPRKYIFNSVFGIIASFNYDKFGNKDIISKLRLQGYPCGGHTLFKPNKNTSIEVGFKYKDGKMMPDVIINGKILDLEEEN